MNFQLKRIMGYLMGFVLFYAPFALFQKTVCYFLAGECRPLTIHSLCLRIQTEHLLDGKLFKLDPVFVICFFIFLFVAMLLGPVYCGKLCPAGAVTEYLSRLVPDKFKINWLKYTDVEPIRYGMLFGFMLLPFFDMVVACVYCNFFLFDMFVNYVIFGKFVSLTSGLILTLLLWIVLFGLFTKGGRGFCNFMCPVGAVQTLFYSFTCRLPFVYKLKIDDRCVGCKKCTKVCPTGAMKVENKRASVNVHNCILCGECINRCPRKSIKYGR